MKYFTGGSRQIDVHLRTCLLAVAVIVTSGCQTVKRLSFNPDGSGTFTADVSINLVDLAEKFARSGMNQDEQQKAIAQSLVKQAKAFEQAMGCGFTELPRRIPGTTVREFERDRSHHWEAKFPFRNRQHLVEQMNRLTSLPKDPFLAQYSLSGKDGFYRFEATVFGLGFLDTTTYQVQLPGTIISTSPAPPQSVIYTRAAGDIASWSKVSGMASLIANSQLKQPSSARAPVVLVHGWKSDVSIWDTLRPALENTGRFTVYRFGYDWSLPVKTNARILAQFIAKYCGNQPRYIIGHSMGGLVARAYIEDVEAKDDRVSELLGLITLGTPHHGSPLANHAWLENHSQLEGTDPIIAAIRMWYGIDNIGSWELGWDNFDGLMPDDVAKGMNRFVIGELNKPLESNPGRAEMILSKYTFVGSYRTNVPPLPSVLEIEKNTNVLGASILAYAYLDNNSKPVRAYTANDGAVPLTSSLFLLARDDQTNPVGYFSNGTEVSLDMAAVTRRYRIPEQRCICVPDVWHHDLPSDPRVLRIVFNALGVDSPNN